MANFDVINNQALAKQGLPSTQTDGMFTPVRATRYGELVQHSLTGSTKGHRSVIEGSYYTAVNPTAGTAIIDTAALTGFVTTTPTMTVFNNNTVASGINLELDFLRLNVVAPGASGTNWNWAMYLDTGNRYSSGGSTITPVNASMQSNSASLAVINFGAITATAAAAQRKICAQPGRTVIKVAGDEYLFRFGEAVPAVVGMPMEGTLQLQRAFNCPPVVVPPQCTFLFYEWGASQATAASFEFCLAYTER